MLEIFHFPPQQPAPPEAQLDLHDVHERGELLGETTRAPLPRGVRVRKVRDPALVPHPPAHLGGRRPPRDLFRQVQADDVDPLLRTDFLPGDDPFRISIGHLERHVQPVVIGNRDPIHAPLPRALQDPLRTTGAYGPAD